MQKKWSPGSNIFDPRELRTAEYQNPYLDNCVRDIYVPDNTLRNSKIVQGI